MHHAIEDPGERESQANRQTGMQACRRELAIHSKANERTRDEQATSASVSNECNRDGKSRPHNIHSIMQPVHSLTH